MASDTAATHEHGHPDYLAHHFDTPVQQFDAAKIGMWVFLAQEILFFSGLFVAYFIYRAWYPEAFSVGSRLLSWQMGLGNTIVLLFSSFTAAQAVQFSQRGDKKNTGTMLLVTIACAFVFLGVKYVEYSHKLHSGTLPGSHFALSAEGIEEVARACSISHVGDFEPYHLRSFFGIYFIMTGVHGLHVLIGIGIFIWLFLCNARGDFHKKYFTPIDLAALYWHLVDLIWIFLFPLLYLID